MKMMRMKTLFSMTVIFIMLFFLPLIADADSLTWTTENYHVYASAQGTVDEKNSQTPSLTANAQGSGSTYLYGDLLTWTTYASSNITSSDIAVSYTVEGYPFANAWGRAIGEFVGTFTASDPTFQFSYNYSFNTMGADPRSSLWITIDDLTNSTNIYNTRLTFYGAPQTGSDILSINTPIGHDINVKFGVDSPDVDAYEHGWTAGGGILNMTYSMTAVAPEPISSILFLTGGAVLAGRRYLRRKRENI